MKKKTKVMWILTVLILVSIILVVSFNTNIVKALIECDNNVVEVESEADEEMDNTTENSEQETENTTDELFWMILW